MHIQMFVVASFFFSPPFPDITNAMYYQYQQRYHQHTLDHPMHEQQHRDVKACRLHPPLPNLCRSSETVRSSVLAERRTKNTSELESDRDATGGEGPV
jgi:hypothetical protein